jgi:hypothetical protein
LIKRDSAIENGITNEVNLVGYVEIMASSLKYMR